MGPIMTTITEAYNLIKDPEHWTQGFYQKNKEGKNCPWREGYSFCAMGSLNFISGLKERDDSYHGALCILQRHSEKLFGSCIRTVNDSSPPAIAHQNVLRVYESVMERFSDRDPTEEEWTEGVWPKSHQKSQPQAIRFGENTSVA